LQEKIILVMMLMVIPFWNSFSGSATEENNLIINESDPVYLSTFYQDRATNEIWVYRIGSNGDLSRGKLHGDGYETVLACHVPKSVLETLDRLMAQYWWRDKTPVPVRTPVKKNESDKGITWAEFVTFVSRKYTGDAFWNDTRKRFQIKTLNSDGSYSIDDMPRRDLQEIAYRTRYFGFVPGPGA
jgi:hypothetical protein